MKLLSIFKEPATSNNKYIHLAIHSLKILFVCLIAELLTDLFLLSYTLQEIDFVGYLRIALPITIGSTLGVLYKEY